ncbi:MAG: hypothetical protein GYA23_09370 [Methanomicrobiales archaeon]|nr:hypothetical protein [Methanomicrobiales archaeon]
MPREQMVEIKVPARWVEGMKAAYHSLGMDFDKEARAWLRSGFECDLASLPVGDRVRLIDKHKLKDIYNISPRLRNQVKGR